MSKLILPILVAYTYGGAGTIYLEGHELYCDRPSSPLVYSQDTEDWVAFPVELFERGEVQCGDIVHIMVYLPGGTMKSFSARVYDAGPFGDQTEIGGMPIVVDAPPWVAHWPLYPGWAKVVVTNMSAVARECLERGLCD